MEQVMRQSGDICRSVRQDRSPRSGMNRWDACGQNPEGVFKVQVTDGLGGGWNLPRTLWGNTKIFPEFQAKQWHFGSTWTRGRCLCAPEGQMTTRCPVPWMHDVPRGTYPPPSLTQGRATDQQRKMTLDYNPGAPHSSVWQLTDFFCNYRSNMWSLWWGKYILDFLKCLAFLLLENKIIP